MADTGERSWTRAAGYVAALVAGALMGASWPLQKHILSAHVIGPATLHWLNVCGLFAMIVPTYMLRFRGRLRWKGFSPCWLLPFGCVACVMHFCRNFGILATSATTAAVVERSEIAFVFIFSYLILRRPVRALGWLGTAVILYGVTRVALVSSQALHFDALGVAALVIVGVTIAVNALLIKTRFLGIPSELIMLGSMTVQIVVFSVAVPSSGALPTVAELFTRPNLFALVLAGSVVWFVRLWLYYYAMKASPMWAVRMLTLSGLPVATLGDLLVLRAPVTWAHLEGLIAGIGGAAMVIWSANGDVRPGVSETGEHDAGDAGLHGQTG